MTGGSTVRLLGKLDMLLSPDERIPLARLMTFMEHAERLAHDCASAQATLAPEAGMRRFLRAQA